MGVMLMPGELHELSVRIGGLETGLRLLTETVRHNQEQSTDEHRKVHDIVVATSESVRNIADKVAKMEPLTEDYREKRAEARGAARFIKAAYALAGGSIAVGLGEAIKFFSIRPHP